MALRLFCRNEELFWNRQEEGFIRKKTRLQAGLQNLESLLTEIERRVAQTRVSCGSAAFQEHQRVSLT
jgi:hypothetical protein